MSKPKILSDFYTIHDASQESQSFSCILRFNSLHHIFEGHFPGQPVVPGVCSMAIVGNLLTDILEQEVSLKKAAQVKYLRMLQPNDEVEVTLSFTPENEEVKVSSTWVVEGNAAFKFSGVYGLPSLAID